MSFLENNVLEYAPPEILRIVRGNYDLFPAIPEGQSSLRAGQATLMYTGTLTKGTERWEVALVKAVVNYAWYNVSNANYNNAVFTATVGGKTATITIPDGNYTVPDYNTAFIAQQIAQGLYVLDNSGGFVTFITIVNNVVNNNLAFEFQPVVVPASGSNPEGLTTGDTGSITIPGPPSTISQFLGLTPGTYPASPATEAQIVYSNQPVDFFPVQVINVACNLIGQGLYPQATIIHSFTSGNVLFADTVTETPPYPQFFPMMQGIYQVISLQLFDQNGRLLAMGDNQMYFELRLRKMTPYNRS